MLEKSFEFIMVRGGNRDSYAAMLWEEKLDR